MINIKNPGGINEATTKILTKTNQTSTGNTTSTTNRHIDLNKLLRPTTARDITQPPSNTNIPLGKSTDVIRKTIALHCLPQEVDTEIHNYRSVNIPVAIRDILQQHQPPIQKSQWKFERSIQAAKHNSDLLQSYNYNTDEATQALPNTVLTYGSEFRRWQTLEPLLHHHQHWPAIKDIITQGASYPLHPITEEKRLTDIQYMLDRGNHKSATEIDNKKALDKAFTKEVRHQWAIPILPSCIPLIPGASVTPLGWRHSGQSTN